MDCSQLQEAERAQKRGTKAETARRDTELGAARQQLEDATASADCVQYLLDEAHAAASQVPLEAPPITPAPA